MYMSCCCLFASRIAIILFLYLYMYFYRLAVNKSCSKRKTYNMKRLIQNTNKLGPMWTHWVLSNLVSHKATETNNWQMLLGEDTNLSKNDNLRFFILFAEPQRTAAWTRISGKVVLTTPFWRTKKNKRVRKKSGAIKMAWWECSVTLPPSTQFVGVQGGPKTVGHYWIIDVNIHLPQVIAKTTIIIMEL